MCAVFVTVSRLGGCRIFLHACTRLDTIPRITLGFTVPLLEATLYLGNSARGFSSIFMTCVSLSGYSALVRSVFDFYCRTMSHIRVLFFFESCQNVEIRIWSIRRSGTMTMASNERLLRRVWVVMLTHYSCPTLRTSS